MLYWLIGGKYITIASDVVRRTGIEVPIIRHFADVGVLSNGTLSQCWLVSDKLLNVAVAIRAVSSVFPAQGLDFVLISVYPIFGSLCRVLEPTSRFEMGILVAIFALVLFSL